MAVDVTVETTIARTPAEVAAYMFDPKNDLAWTSGIVACHPRQPGPLCKGARVERVAKFLGRKFSYEYEVTAADERSVDMTVEKPFPMQVRYQLDATPDGRGTVASIRARGEPRGFFRVAAPFMTRMVRKNIGKDLALLKRALERRD